MRAAFSSVTQMSCHSLIDKVFFITEIHISPDNIRTSRPWTSHGVFLDELIPVSSPVVLQPTKLSSRFCKFNHIDNGLKYSNKGRASSLSVRPRVMILITSGQGLDEPSESMSLSDTQLY